MSRVYRNESSMQQFLPDTGLPQLDGNCRHNYQDASQRQLGRQKVFEVSLCSVKSWYKPLFGSHRKVFGRSRMTIYICLQNYQSYNSGICPGCFSSHLVAPHSSLGFAH